MVHILQFNSIELTLDRKHDHSGIDDSKNMAKILRERSEELVLEGWLILGYKVNYI